MFYRGSVSVSFELGFLKAGVFVCVLHISGANEIKMIQKELVFIVCKLLPTPPQHLAFHIYFEDKKSGLRITTLFQLLHKTHIYWEFPFCLFF